MIEKSKQREIILQVVPSLKKTLDERIHQRIPAESTQNLLDMKRSVVCHLLADLLVIASKDEIASYGDLVGALVNMKRPKATEDPLKQEEPIG